MIDSICWKCGHKASAPESLAGTSQKCPQCGATRSVPPVRGPDPEPSASQEASNTLVWGLCGSVLLLLGGAVVYFVWATDLLA